MFVFDYLHFVSALMLLVSLLFYFTLKRDYVFSSIMMLNPYLAALLCFYKITFDYFKLHNFRFYSKGVYLFVLFVVFLIFPYFFSSFNARTFIQFIQFIILSFIFLMLITSGRQIIINPEVLLSNFRISSIILSTLKIIGFHVGYEDFFVFGKNEDAMLIVFAGVSSSLYFFLRGKSFFAAVFEMLIYLLAIYYYESRSALFFTITTPFFIVFGYIYANKQYLKNKIYLSMLLVVFILVALNSLEYIANAFGLNQHNNYSNLERLGMYFFTYDFILSGNYLGVGVGNLDLAMESMYLQKYILAIYPHPHSSFLRFILELGLVGLSAYVCFIFYILRVAFVTLAKDRCLGTVLLIYTSSIFYFSLFDSIFFSFFRGVFSLLVLCAFLSLRQQYIYYCR